MLFEVIQGHQFLYQSKTYIIYDFLLVSNSNLHPISHQFRVIADYWSNFYFDREVPVFNKLIHGEPLNSQLRSSSSEN